MTLRRQPDTNSPDMPTTGTVHFHLNIENCDGVNVYMDGTNVCQPPSRAIHVSRVGDAQRLSWMVDVDVDGTLPRGGTLCTDEETDQTYNPIDLFNTVLPEDPRPSEATDICNNQSQNPSMSRSTDYPDNGARSYTSRQHNPYTAQHKMLLRGNTALVQANSELTSLSVDDTPNARQVVMDGKCPLSDIRDGRTRLTSETNRLPQFGAIHRARGNALDGMTHNRYTESTKHITEPVTSTQGSRHPVDGSDHPLSWSPTGSVASAKPVAIVKPKSRMTGTTRGNRSTGTSRDSADSLLTEIDTMVINERPRATTSAADTDSSTARPSSGNGNVHYSESYAYITFNNHGAVLIR